MSTGGLGGGPEGGTIALVFSAVLFGSAEGCTKPGIPGGTTREEEEAEALGSGANHVFPSATAFALFSNSLSSRRFVTPPLKTGLVTSLYG